MKAMACDRCDSVFVTIEESTLTPCPRCAGKTRWATRDEVTEHLRRPRRTDGNGNGAGDVPLPALTQRLRAIGAEVCESAREVCEESRETRERSRQLREQRRNGRNEEGAP